MSTPDTVGAVVGERYQLTYVVPEVPNSTAAFAHDRKTDSLVFIKLVQGEEGDVTRPWPDAWVRLEREADMLESLSHPQIPRLLDADVEAETPYIVTEYKPGNEHNVRRGWLKSYSAPRLAAAICLSALEPIGYLGERSIAHRDVKPANLVIPFFGEVALVDFELAVCVDKQSAEQIYSRSNVRDSRITDPAYVRGTADYLAPERICGNAATPQSDLYALGVILYEFLYGRMPYKLTAEYSVAEQQYYKLIDLTKPPDREIPNQLLDIIDKATRKQLGDRYATAAEMAEDLERYLVRAA